MLLVDKSMFHVGTNIEQYMSVNLRKCLQESWELSEFTSYNYWCFIYQSIEVYIIIFWASV